MRRTGGEGGGGPEADGCQGVEAAADCGEGAGEDTGHEEAGHSGVVSHHLGRCRGATIVT